jgi:hypothetical protein
MNDVSDGEPGEDALGGPPRRTLTSAETEGR